MIIITITFIGMMVFPLVGAYWFYRKVKGDVLYINQDKTRDPRYFATSFTQMIDSQWENFQNVGTICLSREEDVLLADEVSSYPKSCELVVIAEKIDFKSPILMEFHKEIYAMQNAELHGPLKARAIACKKDLIIKRNVNIIRWADAEGVLKVENNCDLGVSATSKKEIIIGNNCEFRRLYAPKIFLGQHKKVVLDLKDRVQKLNDFKLLNKIKYNMKYVDNAMSNEQGIIDFSLVSKHDLVVLDDLIINGNLRSSKRLRICDNVIISGNVFADDDVLIGRNVVIYGNVFSQGNIKIEQGTVIGKENNISSVIARGSITFEKNCVVYGYISNEQGGMIY